MRAVALGAVVVLALVAALGVAHANETTLSAHDGRTWHDYDFDGEFADGASSANTGSYAIVSDRGNHATRVGLEFDLSPVPTGQVVASASLLLTFYTSRDLNDGPHSSDPVFGPPTLEMHGFTGNGQVTSSDMLTSNLLGTFLPDADSTVTLDVTEWVAELIQDNERYVGFMFRIVDDLDLSTHAVASFSAGFYDSATVPMLSVTLVPEPTTTHLLEFFDDSVADGTLYGVGNGNSADTRLAALRNKIEAADDLVADEKYAEAYDKLAAAYKFTDGEGRPPDSVGGSSADDLADMILAVMDGLT